MLRITRIDRNGLVLLKLEGKLLAPWTGEVLTEVGLGTGDLGGVGLDLREVSYVDGAGLALLRTLVQRGVVIEACSSFVAELLHVEKP